MIAALYPTKSAMKACLGKPLRFQETSLFGNEYKDNGTMPFVGPGATCRKFYGEVTLKDGLIARVK